MKRGLRSAQRPDLHLGVAGHALQRDTTAFVTGAGGKVLGGIAYPFPGTTDFSSYLIQAQASGAQVLGRTH